MAVDAIVLTGGRSSRLEFVAKSELHFGNETLLQRTLSAVSAARTIVVVGPDPGEPLPAGVLRTQENPPFGGPVEGIHAGLMKLAEHSAEATDAVLVLACDMPHIDRAIPLLVQGLMDNPGSDGVIALDRDRLQPLAAGIRSVQLGDLLAHHQSTGSLAGMSMFHFIDDLNLTRIAVPDGATDDVDTWEDARRLGALAPGEHE